MREELREYALDDRYSMFLHHLLGTKHDAIEKLTNNSTIGELLVIISYINAAIVTQLPTEYVEEYSRMTLAFGRQYPTILRKAGEEAQTAGRLTFVVPVVEGIDYSKPANIEDYLSPEELDKDFSLRGRSNQMTPESTNSFISKDISKTIQ